MARERYTFYPAALPWINRQAGAKHNMIGPNARVGIAVSGGVDSWVLLQVLHLRRRVVPFNYDIMALHINPGFAPHNHAPLLDWLERRRRGQGM